MKADYAVAPRGGNATVIYGVSKKAVSSLAEVASVSGHIHLNSEVCDSAYLRLVNIEVVMNDLRSELYIEIVE